MGNPERTVSIMDADTRRPRVGTQRRALAIRLFRWILGF